MSSGVYQITNKVNGKFYVGSAVNLVRRKKCHFVDLRRGKHANAKLQRAFNKYGEDAFEWSILEFVNDASLLIEIEQRFIDSLLPAYNICKTAGSRLGMAHTEESKKKMSDARKGQKNGPHSEETKSKIGAAHKGRTFSEETKRKISDARKGWRCSEEHKQKIRGRKATDEQRRKMSEARKGKPGRPHSEASRQKMSASAAGRTFSPEIIAKMNVSRAMNRRRKLENQPNLFSGCE